MAKYGDEIKAHLEQAVTNLQTAKELFAAGQYEAAASRAAEAGFHTASALLLDEEIETSRHGDVLTLIQQLYVDRRRLTKEQGEKLSWLFQVGKAGNADTNLALIPGEAQKAIEFAESFFEATKVILES
jgi:uncharacterized protein (UPF0332 family)